VRFPALRTHRALRYLHAPAHACCSLRFCACTLHHSCYPRTLLRVAVVLVRASATMPAVGEEERFLDLLGSNIRLLRLAGDWSLFQLRCHPVLALHRSVTCCAARAPARAARTFACLRAACRPSALFSRRDACYISDLTSYRLPTTCGVVGTACLLKRAIHRTYAFLLIYTREHPIAIPHCEKTISSAVSVSLAGRRHAAQISHGVATYLLLFISFLYPSSPASNPMAIKPSLSVPLRSRL